MWWPLDGTDGVVPVWAGQGRAPRGWKPTVLLGSHHPCPGLEPAFCPTEFKDNILNLCRGGCQVHSSPQTHTHSTHTSHTLVIHCTHKLITLHTRSSYTHTLHTLHTLFTHTPHAFITHALITHTTLRTLHTLPSRTNDLSRPFVLYSDKKFHWLVLL